MTRKFNIMEDFEIDEISGVDRPAQPGARVTLMKRDVTDQDDGEGEGGHTRTADESQVTAGRNEEDSMTIKNQAAGEQAVTKEQFDEVQAKLDNVTAELQLAKAFGALTDAEKAHAATLAEGDDRVAFINKSADERQAIIEKATAADPVVYTCDDGTEIRKSEGDLAARLAKSNDEIQRQLQVEKAARRNEELAKAARETLPALPGDELAKVELMRAVQSITDADLRKGVETILSAANEHAQLALGTTGTVAKSYGGDSMDPGEELEMRARKRAKERKMPFSQAFKEEIMTDEGRELMRRSRQS